LTETPNKHKDSHHKNPNSTIFHSFSPKALQQNKITGIPYLYIVRELNPISNVTGAFILALGLIDEVPISAYKITTPKR
jgi:hypothetical protein